MIRTLTHWASRWLPRTKRPRLSRRQRRTRSGSEPLESRVLLAVTFEFDYRFDTAGFFDAADRRETLELAGQILSSKLGDSLSAISPGGGNSWTANFIDPGTGKARTWSNLNVAADEILVFAGARNMSGSIAQGGWGGSQIQGDQQWIDTVLYRGQAKNGTDFAPWGGTLSFNTGRDWHFGRTVEGLGLTEFDFLSLAVHELTHVLGYSTQNESYARHVSGDVFRGPRAVAEYDGSGFVPLSGDGAHWAPGTLDEGQRVLMDPAFSKGVRENLTWLDLAAIDDIGWNVDRSARDYGDAPSSDYPTLLSQDGAWHNIKRGLFLGVTADGESDGQISDDDDELDDDDGVQFIDSVFAGRTVSVEVTANRDGILNAWLDFNRDGDWADPGEAILSDIDLSPGSNILQFVVPEDAQAGESWSRFRLSTAGGLEPTGGAADGEVEDHPVTIVRDLKAVDDQAALSAGTSVTLNVVANDLPTGDARVIGFEQPDQGSVVLNRNGTVTFTTASDDSGTTSFQYSIGLVQDRIVGPAGEAAEFGRAVTAAGDTLIVGAPLAATVAGSATGLVAVYHRSGSDWELAQTITAFDQAAGDRFGFSVALDGNMLVVGSRSDDDAGLNSGSVYVYRRPSPDGPFLLVQKLQSVSGRPRDQFGYSVSIDGDTLAVGVRLDDQGGTNSGSVEVFTRPNVNSEFAFEQRVRPDVVEKGDQFGAAVVVQGDELFVGARKDNNAKTNAGAVYVFARSDSQWDLLTTVLPVRPEDNGYFGHAIDVDGDTLVVGQPSRSRQSRTGRVFIHSRTSGGSDQWGLQKELNPDSQSGGNRFGFAVTVSRDHVLVGGPRMPHEGRVAGTAAVYQRDEGGSANWGRTRVLTAANFGGGDEFGYALALSGTRVFVGARREDSGGRNAGAVYVDDLRTDFGEVTVTIG